jgi:hypothetical protein
MGDRGIAILKFPDEYGADLAVYSHWTGSVLRDEVEAITATLAFRARLGDETYAARIVVDQLTKSGRDQETGFGVFPVRRGNDPSGFSDGDVEVTLDLTTGKVS